MLFSHIGASFVSLAPIFYHNQSALTPLLLLFYKKSRAAHLFGYGDFPSRLRPSQRFAVATTFRAFARATPAVKMPKVSFYAISHRLDPEPNALPVLILLTQCMKFFCDAADETFAAPVRAAGWRQLKPMIKPPPTALLKHCMIYASSATFPHCQNTESTKKIFVLPSIKWPMMHWYREVCQTPSKK